MKKLIAILLVCVLTLTMFTACASNETATKTEEPSKATDESSKETAPAADGEKKITIMVESGSMAEDVAKLTAEDFKALTGYEVVIDPVPYTGMYDKLSTEIRAGVYTHDVAIIAHEWIGGLSEGLLPINDMLTPEIEEDLMPGLIDSASFDGNLYGIPLWTNCTVLIYRKDWFNDAANKAAFEAEYGYELKVPETWEEYYDCAEFFTSEDVYGCAVVGKPGDASVDRFIAASRQAGAVDVIFDQDGNCIVNSQPYVDGAVFIRDLYLNGYAPEETLTIADAESQELFKNGKIAMQQEWTHQYADAVKEMGVDVVGVAPNIAGAGGVSSFTGPWCASTFGTENVDIAKQYIKYLYDNNEAFMNASLRVASRRSVLEAYAEKEGYEHIDAMLETLGSDMITNRSARFVKWKQYEEILSAALQSIFAGADPQQALDQAAAEIADIGL